MACSVSACFMGGYAPPPCLFAPKSTFHVRTQCYGSPVDCYGSPEVSRNAAWLISKLTVFYSSFWMSLCALC